MSKDSIRNKIKKLQEESEEILKSSDLSKEIRLFITSIMFMIDIIVDVFLVKKVRKTSSNSGVPPSQNFGSNGNGNKLGDSETDKKGSQLPNTRNVTEEFIVDVSECEGCGTAFSSGKACHWELFF